MYIYGVIEGSHPLSLCDAPIIKKEGIMGYISKIDTKFMTFVSRKYNKDFNYFDDYAIWLYDKFGHDEGYYHQLEQDIWAYSDFQTGTPRKKDRVNKKRVAL